MVDLLLLRTAIIKKAVGYEDSRAHGLHLLRIIAEKSLQQRHTSPVHTPMPPMPVMGAYIEIRL